MLRRVSTVVVFSALAVPTAAAAAEAEVGQDVAKDVDLGAKESSAGAQEPPAERSSVQGATAGPARPSAAAAEAPTSGGLLEGWRTEIHGYFRAPMALGISSRPNPNPDGSMPDGPSKLQISYGPNRVIDWSYYSFAYTRLQEQDWAELTVHVKKTHVDAQIGWMGYWLAAAGSRNPDAAAVPGIASLTLDTDFKVGDVTPNVALQMGAWWPGFGYFEKYDTFTLGRFRQMGAQARLAVPVSPDLKITLFQGLGTGRDGKFDYNTANNSPLYASRVGLDLIYHAHLQVVFKDNVTVGLHYNNSWTRDPWLTKEASPGSGKTYADAADAHLSVVGAEINVTLPYLGHLWLSPSYISTKNGWALGGQGGTEVLHAQNGLGIAGNYLAWTGSPPDSTGSGSIASVGFLYENSLSNVLGKRPSVPDLKASVFALFANSSLDLPAGTQISQSKIHQFKYGVDVTWQMLEGLGLMLRGDTVNYDTDHPGFIFSALTSRLILSSHYLSGECIYLQYSRYIYGDQMVLAGKWPWNTPLVAGTDVIQGGVYNGTKPDENVVKMQAQITF